MSDKKFFVTRYEELGWEYKDVNPRQAIRINSINAKEAVVTKRLRALGIKLEKIPFLKNGYWIQESKFSVGATSEYLLGLHSIQEAAAQMPATLFTEPEDKMVLDACAAPGGKTVKLADLMRNTGVIIALDVKKRRLTALSNHLERCRVRDAIVYHMDVRQVSKLKVRFDRILLDVSCSGNFVTDKDWFKKNNQRREEKRATPKGDID